MTEKKTESPAELRARYGTRFHHFHDNHGRLVATLVTEPSALPAAVRAAVAIVSKKEPNVSRAQGRKIALGRLRSDIYLLFDLATLKQAITHRTILTMFPGGKRLGPNKLRPRAEFFPDRKPIYDDHTMAWIGDDDLPF